MTPLQLYQKTCIECSQLITNRYSTSFSMGIRVFDKRFRAPIYAVYGFVRFADEIVDSFHQYPKAALLQRFREDTHRAIEEGISLNPVLQTFQQTVNTYHIERELIDAFLDSMEMDLHFHKYEDNLYKQYIYGSAEVVGLMCLRVFVEGDEAMYQHLKASAQSLGAAFQKLIFCGICAAILMSVDGFIFPAWISPDSRHKTKQTLKPILKKILTMRSSVFSSYLRVRVLACIWRMFITSIFSKNQKRPRPPRHPRADPRQRQQKTLLIIQLCAPRPTQYFVKFFIKRFE